MRGIDLSRYRFDYDLTFSILLMHPNGHIYHRFGGRDHTDPLIWISMPSLLSLMTGTLEDHSAYVSAGAKPPNLPPRRGVEDFRSYKTWIKGRPKIECIHCHQIGEHEVGSGELDGTWTGKDIWRYPSPAKIGLRLDPADQSKVKSVDVGSPAAAGGLEPGDRLERIIRHHVRSVNDVQAALHEAPGGRTTIPVRFRRDGKEQQARLTLPDGWKVGDALTFSWRPLKWPMRPGPGFGGKDLTAQEKKNLGLDPDGFAFRITYLVTWGRNAHVGRNAARAGLRNGDIVYSVAGKIDFHDQSHFHSWFRLNVKAGQVVKFETLRGKRRRAIEMKAIK